MEVIAYIYNKKIGTLYEDEGIIRFEYDSRYINSGLNISPLKLPFSTETYINMDNKYFQTLAGVFFDSLPDRFGTKVLERYYESKNIAPKDLTTLQKLVFIGKRGMGAIEYEPSEKILDTPEAFEPLEIRKMYESSRKIIKGEPTETIKEMLLFMDSAASAGGARAKAIVGWNKNTNEIISGSGSVSDEYEQWLIKFDGVDDEKQSLDFTKLEYLYMNMAKACGIIVPAIELIKDDNLSHFAIKRFDRIDGEKVHMHSLASIVHVNFNEPLHYSYDEAMRVIKHITKDAQAVVEFFKRMIFNVVAVNQDDHAKNTSFLMDSSGEWTLSPAYDITYANGQGYTKNHQMSIMGKINNFSKKELVEFGIKFGVNKKDAVEIIENTVDIISTFSKKAKKLDIREDLISLVEKDIIERGQSFLETSS